MKIRTFKLLVVFIEADERKEIVQTVRASHEHTARRKIMDHFLERKLQVKLISNHFEDTAP